MISVDNIEIHCIYVGKDYGFLHINKRAVIGGRRRRASTSSLSRDCKSNYDFAYLLCDLERPKQPDAPQHGHAQGGHYVLQANKIK